MKKPSRREKINLMLSPEERTLIKEKAIKYGYGDKIAEYARDACIHERIYVEEINGKKEVCGKVDEYIKDIRQYSKKQSDILKNITIAKTDIEILKAQNIKINKSIKELKTQVVAILSSNTTQKFQKRLRLVEKNRTTKEFIDSVISKKFVLIIPSSLSLKRITEGVILSCNDNYKSYDIEFINYDAIRILIDEQRELALQNNFYLLIIIENNNFFIFLARYYKNLEEGLKMYDLEKKQGINNKLYDCVTKTELKEG